MPRRRPATSSPPESNLTFAVSVQNRFATFRHPQGLSSPLRYLDSLPAAGASFPELAFDSHFVTACERGLSKAFHRKASVSYLLPTPQQPRKGAASADTKPQDCSMLRQV